MAGYGEIFQATVNGIQTSADEPQENVPEKQHKPSKRKLVGIL